MTRRLSRFALLVAVGSALAPAALAQQVLPLPQIGRPPGELIPEPEYLKPRPVPGLVLPPRAVEPRERGRAGTAPRVRVARIEVTGSTVFTEVQLRAVVAPFENRELDSEDLEEIRHRLSRLYVDNGYINSGALLPDQDVSGGTVTYRIVEGRLTAIEISGENGFRGSFIADRIALGAGEPLNVGRLQESIQILLQNPQIERVNAELAPGAERGEAVLQARVKEAERWRVGAQVANERPPSIGSLRTELSAAARNLTGWGDTLGIWLGSTQGSSDQTLSATLPVSAHDTTLSYRYGRIRSHVIEAPFNAIDLRNQTQSNEYGISHPFYRTLRRTLTLGAGVYERDNASFLLGTPFSFTPGLIDGRSRVVALRTYADWLDRTEDQVLAARLTVTSGLGAGGATRSTENTPDSQYRAVIAQLQFARRLAADGRQLMFRFDGQTSNSELLPSEKFAIGGAASVRGYREYVIVRDEGWSSTLEYRHPLGRVPLPWVADQAGGAGLVQLALFADFGRAWDHVLVAERRAIWSYGLGLRWDIAEGFSAQLMKGFAQRHVPTPGGDLQDQGVHFRVAGSVAF